MERTGHDWPQEYGYDPTTTLFRRIYPNTALGRSQGAHLVRFAVGVACAAVAAPSGTELHPRFHRNDALVEPFAAPETVAAAPAPPRAKRARSESPPAALPLPAVRLVIRYAVDPTARASASARTSKKWEVETRA